MSLQKAHSWLSLRHSLRDPPLPSNCRRAVTFDPHTSAPESRHRATVFGGTRTSLMRSTFREHDEKGRSEIVTTRAEVGFWTPTNETAQAIAAALKAHWADAKKVAE